MSISKMPWSARIGLLGVIIFLGSAIFAPWLAPYGEADIVGEVWAPTSVGQQFGLIVDLFGDLSFSAFIDQSHGLWAGSNAFWLGTDQIGRDMLTRMLYGARMTIFVAGAATLLSFSMGVFLGFLAAVLRGWVDQTLSRFNDLMMSIPTLIFALVVLSVLPVNMVTLILVMAVLDSTRVFRISRAVAVDIAVLDFVEAARLRGEKQIWIIFREILPNALSPLFAELGLRFAFAVLFLSSLSFLGLGIQPPAADWGSMVKDNKDGIVFGISAALIPAGAIAGLAISVNLVVDWVLNRTSSLKGGRG
ncbi:ABC transporter permease [Aestuariispira ectoiniformans]|uniref:ABC transporter permease n=1 Tax=Aestuariispira ectoiniformans TaxID=2775080 RepID=UPI00223BDA92|nr:ABC transporter permease [Aestuariispira ectoiniformans]